MEPTQIVRITDVKLISADEVEATFIGAGNFGFVARMKIETLAGAGTEVLRLQAIKKIEGGEV